MIIAIAFSCSGVRGISVRGIVFCPDCKSSFLVSRLSASGYQPADKSTAGQRGTGADWLKEHFHFTDTSPPSVAVTPLSFKRYFAFARVDDIYIRENHVSLGFDVFVGPGDFSLPTGDGYMTHTPSRAIHGFAHVTHHPVLNHAIAASQGHSMSGHAALCFVEKPDDLLSKDWAVRRDGLFQVVPQNEVGAVMMVQAPPHRANGHVGLDPNFNHSVRNPLLRGFVFRAGLIAELPKINERRAVGL